jgi:pSer/pThr/pTyr-binding forkhead associated (FHA) protein
MSGSHCSFEITARGQVMFTDMGSTNGSYFNNSKISQTVVKINDVIRIGDTIIKLEEKRLTASERMAIGVSTYREDSEKTLPGMGNSEKLLIQKHEDQMDREAEKSPKKRTVILDKNIKMKKKAPLTFARIDTIHDQEPSSGTTKMLKLDHDDVPAKKKKP